MENCTSSSPVVGIDLGTTFSCIAHYTQGRAEVIPDQCGDRLIPSFVFYDPKTGDVHVGKIAYDLATICPGNGIRDVKRVIGRRYDDEFLKEYRNFQQTHFTIVEQDNLAVFEIQIKGEKITKTPEEVSSEILKYLKNAASSYLAYEVTEAVVSIPAYFSNSQRKATKKAAELAGLTVLKLITEPVAGAIHYSKNRNIDANIIVVDWGGGTLDVSFIEMSNKTFTVKAVNGDTLLGGRNIDEKLFKHFYKPVKRFPHQFMQRLLQECIVIKERLSITNAMTKIMHCVDGDTDLTLSLTKGKFEELSQPTFEQVMNIIELGLNATDWSNSDIDEVVLIGGSTRIPKIRFLLGTFFDIRKLKTDLNPDEAVACGACIQASLLKHQHQELLKYRITEVTPLSLGLASSENLFVVFIEKNSSLPAHGSTIFVTVYNNQKTMSITIFEGERKNSKFNNKLGEFDVKNLPPRRAGDVKVSIKFNLDEDGILTVTANEINSGESNSLEVAMGQFWLTGRNVRTSLNEAQKHKLEDQIFEKFALRKQDVVKKCRHILYDLDKISSQEDRDFVKTKCQDFLSSANEIDYTNIEALNKLFSAMQVSIDHLM